MKMFYVCFAAAQIAGAATAHAADAAHPTVVELFQSQGCSSCPPANANFIAIAGRPDVLALSWEVTYWDYLGWTDTFGDQKFTARQYEYARGLGHAEVFTPQIVVNGRTDVVGNHADELKNAIARADRGLGGPSLHLTETEVEVGAGAGQAEILLVRYDPNVLMVPIQHGENGGITLPHRNIVRQILKLGPWDGAPRRYTLPPAHQAGLKTAILVQLGKGGPILAAAHS